jgi:hypothetical protein
LDKILPFNRSNVLLYIGDDLLYQTTYISLSKSLTEQKMFNSIDQLSTNLSILQITQITMQYSILFITNDVNVKFSAHDAFLE